MCSNALAPTHQKRLFVALRDPHRCNLPDHCTLLRQRSQSPFAGRARNLRVVFLPESAAAFLERLSTNQADRQGSDPQHRTFCCDILPAGFPDLSFPLNRRLWVHQPRLATGPLRIEPLHLSISADPQLATRPNVDRALALQSKPLRIPVYAHRPTPGPHRQWKLVADACAVQDTE